MSLTYDPREFVDDTPAEVGDWDNWREDRPQPVSVGRYFMLVNDIRDARNFTTKDGRTFVEVTLDFTIINDDTNEGRTLTYQRLNNMPRKYGNKSSALVDLLKSADVVTPPITNSDFVEQVAQLALHQVPVYGRVDWEAFCTTCYHQAKDAGEEYPGDFGKKASTYKKFPDGPDGEKLDAFECSCGEQVFARPFIRTFLVPPAA